MMIPQSGLGSPQKPFRTAGVKRWKLLQLLPSTTTTHGHESRGIIKTHLHKILSGDTNAHCRPPDYVMFENVKDQVVCITFTTFCRKIKCVVMAISDMLHIIHFSYNTPKHAISSEKIRPIPQRRGYALLHPMLPPHQAFGIRP